MRAAAATQRSHRRAAGRFGWLLVVLIMLLLIPWGLCGEAADRAAPWGHGTGGAVKPSQFFGTVVLGGFRAVLIDYLWVRSDILDRRKDYYGLLATYEMLADLQPHAERVWVFNSSTMVYDICAEYNTAAGRYAWVRAGLKFALKGLENNPDSEVIRSHLADTFYYKFSYQGGPYSREFRRLLREESDKGILRAPERPSVAREALLYWEDILKGNPQAGAKMHEFRVWAACTLLAEQEVGLREARLEMLEAREGLLRAASGETGRCGEALEKRREEYERALHAPPQLSAEEAASLRARIDESLAALAAQATFVVNLTALRTWEDDCRLALKEIDRALDAYQNTLDGLEKSEDGDSEIILDPEEVKRLEARDMADILPVNSLYVAPIYAEVVRRIKQAVKQ